VAHIIAANQNLAGRRQVFFVSIGGFDTRASQNSIQPNLMAQLDHGLAYFDATLQALNLGLVFPNLKNFSTANRGFV